MNTNNKNAPLCLSYWGPNSPSYGWLGGQNGITNLQKATIAIVLFIVKAGLGSSKGYFSLKCHGQVGKIQNFICTEDCVFLYTSIAQ